MRPAVVSGRMLLVKQGGGVLVKLLENVVDEDFADGGGAVLAVVTLAITGQDFELVVVQSNGNTVATNRFRRGFRRARSCHNAHKIRACEGQTIRN